MLKSIPDVESTTIEKEIRRQEKQELSIIKNNLWNKWRGKMKVKEGLVRPKETKESEKIEKKLSDIEKKVIV